MLPKPGIYYLPWEVTAGHVPDGGALRTFGRLRLYDVMRSRVTLTAQHGSDQHQVLVCTELVEPFQAQVGSLYMVLGDLEHQDGKCGPCSLLRSGLSGGRSSGYSGTRSSLASNLQGDLRGVPFLPNQPLGKDAWEANMV